MKNFILFITCSLILLSVKGQSLQSKLNTIPSWEKNNLNHLLKRNIQGSESLPFIPANHTGNRNRPLKTGNAVLLKMDSLIVTDYNELSGLQDTSSKDEFTYENSGSLSTFTESEWNSANHSWVLSYKLLSSFDDYGNTIRQLGYSWNETMKVWLEVNRDDYSFDSSENLILHEYFLKGEDSVSWVPGYKDEYTCTANSRLAYRSFRDAYLNVWVLAAKTETENNSSGKVILETITGWNPDSVSWVNDSKTEYTYIETSNGRECPELVLTSYWNHLQNTWTPGSRQEFTYDSKGDLAVYIESEWYGNWEPHNKETFSYNDQFSCNELVVPELFMNNPTYFNHMLTDCSVYSTLNSPGWESSGAMQYYYSEMVYTGIPEHTMPGLTIYPNPARNSVSFSWEAHEPSLQLEMYSASGKRVLQQSIHPGREIPVNHLAIGLYLCRLSNEHKLIFTQKLIVE